LKGKNMTFVFLVIWCILVLTYFTVWENNWFILISTNALLLLKLFLDFRSKKE
jgi:membrane-bound metal-dependent hydrolase YbcI (DUF457 family)